MRTNFTRAQRTSPVRSASRELLAVGLFGKSSQLGDRIEVLLRRGREFSPRASLARVAASAVVLVALAIAGSRSPRWIAFAQAQPSFEVASVKPSPPSAGFGMQFLPGGRLTATGQPLGIVVASAYGVPFQSARISGGPDWMRMRVDRYDIEATAGPGAIPI